MGTSPNNVVDLGRKRATAEARAAVKALMSVLATLSGEVKRLERVVARYGI